MEPEETAEPRSAPVPRQEPETRTSTLALRGVKWTATGMGAQKLFQFLFVICLARLLTPGDFGLVAIATLVLALVARIRQLGLHGALVRSREKLEEAANASLLLNVGVSALMYALIVAASPLIARFFDDPRAGSVIRVMALQILAGGAAAVPRSLTVRDLAFRRQAGILWVETVLTGIVSVALAMRGFGVWALVYGTLTGSLCAALLWWLCTPWRPTTRFDWTVARALVRFGVGLWSASNLSYLIDITGKVAVGRFLGVVPLGFYELTNRAVHVSMRSMIATGSGVALPAFCREQEDLPRIRRWYITMLGYVCLLTAPGAAALALLADQIVPTVYGAQWLPIVPLVRVLAPVVFLAPLMDTWYVYVSSGRADLLTRLMILRFAVTVPALLLAARVSVFAVCATESVMLALLTPVNLWLVRRLIGFSSRDLWRALLRPLPATVAFVAVVLTVRFVGRQCFAGPGFGALACYAVPALLVYATVVLVRSPHVIAEVREWAVVALGGRDKACKQGADPLSR